jgi:Ca2+-binding EF-hand superfamily protein|tara:strand:+ start:290 stop:508 length:219 start_codon:yes stop_codon:yes gene_type:complete
LVIKAFNKFDKYGKGVIDINDLRNYFHAKHHPLVIAKKKTEKEILQEFLLTFETHHKDRYRLGQRVKTVHES